MNGDAAASPPVRRLADWDAGTLRELAATHGTPLYVTDLDRVRENCARLRAAFPGADVHYATKANAGRAVLETVREAGVGVECASAGEVRRALDAGFAGERVRYTPVNPPARDLDAVVDWWRDGCSLSVTAGARDTLDRLAERGYDGRLCVRVNPAVGAGHHEKVRTGADATFGVPYGEAPSVVADARDRFDVEGLHAHAGSGFREASEVDDYVEMVERVADLARRVGDLRVVDVGGGFGVPTRPGESPLDLGGVADRVADALDGVDARLVVEPGRYVVADAAVLLARVTAVKETEEGVVVGADAGMTDLVRPAMYDAHHEVRTLSEPGGTRTEDGANAPEDRRDRPVTVAGPVCEGSDVLWRGRGLAAERGDLLAVGNAGAYGYAMASTYNSRPRPADVSLDGQVLRRRERLDDLTRLEVDRR